jgi:hypothetical protein
MTNQIDEEQNKYAWINFASDDDLPHLKDGGYYKNINIIRFEIPAEDTLELKDRVLSAVQFLDLDNYAN